MTPAALGRSVAGRAFGDYLRRLFAYRERLTPSEWCARNLELPPGKNETKAGKLDWNYSPFLREPLDQLAVPGVTDIIFVGPTRIGKTLLLRLGVAYGIAGDPAPALWIDSTEDKARSISRKEIQPLIEHNKILRDCKPANRHNFSDLMMLFPAAFFTMVGGNSPAGVAGDTVTRLFGNEVDKWRGASDKEAATIELARHRTESAEEYRRHMWSCTPTIEEGTIWVWFQKGDQRHFYVICPDCGHAQRLVWGQVAWDPGAQLSEHVWDLAQVGATARYRCANTACGARWDDRQRLLAIRHPEAHWRSSAPGEPGIVSYHINGLYGPLKSNRLGELAKDFLGARTTGFFTDRQDFWNSRMGEPWRESVATIDAEKFAAIERPYRRGTCPPDFKPDLLIIGGDVQSNRLEWVAALVSYAGDAYTLDHGEAATWSDLEDIQTTYAPLAPMSFVILDMNFEDRRAETLEQIYARRERGWFAAEGFEFAKETARLERADVYLGGKLAGHGHTVPKLVISLYPFKVELEKRLGGEIKSWFSYSLDGGELQLAPPDETSVAEQRAYYAQLLDERRVPRKPLVAGKPPFVFKSRRNNNHKWDCWVYILALLWILRKRKAAQVKQPAAGGRKVVEVRST